MSAGSISVRFGADRPSRSRFQYWNRLTDASRFMSPCLALAPIGCFKVKQTGAVVWSLCGSKQDACQRDRDLFTIRAPLRLISGLGCAPGPRVALIASLRACGHQARGLQSLIWESHARPAVQEIYLGRLFFCRRVEHRKLGSGRLPALAVRARAGQSAASARALAGTPKKDHSAFGADGLSRSRKKRPTIFRRKPSTQQESRRASAVTATRGLSSKHNDDRTFH